MIKLVELDAIDEGFRKMDTFAMIHQDEPITEQVEAVDVFAESLGIDAERKAVLYEHVLSFRSIQGDLQRASWMLCGILVGLAIAEADG